MDTEVSMSSISPMSPNRGIGNGHVVDVPSISHSLPRYGAVDTWYRLGISTNSRRGATYGAVGPRRYEWCCGREGLETPSYPDSTNNYKFFPSITSLVLDSLSKEDD